jgi:probable phosphoglycerate mutase
VDGRSDPPLNERGREQAAAIAGRLVGERLAALFTTPLRRTTETAVPILEHHELEAVVLPQLGEVFLGDWEGGEFRHRVAEGHPAAVRMAVEERWDAIPGAEPVDAFGARVRAGLERVVSGHPDQRVVVVSHGGVIGELVRQAVDGNRAFAFVGADNGSITHLVVSEDRWVVRRFNDTAHLADGFDLDPEPSLPEGDQGVSA